MADTFDSNAIAETINLGAKSASRIDNQNKSEYIGQYSVTIAFKDKKVILDASNIRELYFIEDILSTFIYGKITFIDSANLIESGPIIGGEVLSIIYGDGSSNIEKKFIINRVSDISKVYGIQEQSKTACSLDFVDPYSYLFNLKRFSYSWSNIKTSDIIKDLTKNFMSIPDEDIGLWEDSKENLEYFYIPRWNVRQTIKWLMDRSSNENGDSGFLYFQNTKDAVKRQGKSLYNFITINSLFKQQEKIILSGVEDDGSYMFETPNLTEYNKVLSFSISGRDDNARDYLMGGRMYGYDIRKKRFIDTKDTLTYKTQLDKTNILGAYSLFTDISDNDCNHYMTGENDETYLNNLFYTWWIKRYILQLQVVIDVRGHEGRYCGGKIELKWPSSYQEELYNKGLMGEYVVKSITHYFGNFNPSYIQRMVLVKNAYQDSNNTELLKSEKK